MFKLFLLNIYTVCIADQNELLGRKCLEELKQKHGAETIMFAQCDVRKTEDLEAAFKKTKSTFGRLDILANNAGVGLHPDSNLVVDVNLKAVINGTELGLKHMGKDTGGDGGVIINTASMSAFLILPHSPAYSATKAGVMMFSRSHGVPQHFEKHGVRVNCICPSFTPTAMLDELLKNTEIEKFIRMVGIVDIGLVIDGFMQLVEDTSKNGACMRVTSQKGIDYKIFAEDRAKEAIKNSKL
ncbi:15-hydroxyprostaglandin dehydrogenase [NAD(+)]-like isoform X2 [Lineus longissimus]|uniref:15-hydroxyprostaglandin dehydrogenase [NAD(+)]-like isoform X2 n=1 Tax=Lineus longissimus TaxID=88925 RepID=UPI002B4EFC16